MSWLPKHIISNDSTLGSWQRTHLYLLLQTSTTYYLCERGMQSYVKLTACRGKSSHSVSSHVFFISCTRTQNKLNPEKSQQAEQVMHTRHFMPMFSRFCIISASRKRFPASCRPGSWRNAAQPRLTPSLLDVSHMVTGWQRLHDTGHWMLAGEAARSKQAGVAMSPSAPAAAALALCLCWTSEHLQRLISRPMTGPTLDLSAPNKLTFSMPQVAAIKMAFSVIVWHGKHNLECYFFCLFFF